MAMRSRSKRKSIIRGCCEDRYHNSRLLESCCYPHDGLTTLLADSVQSDVRELLLLSVSGSCQNCEERRLVWVAIHRFDGSLLRVYVLSYHVFLVGHWLQPESVANSSRLELVTCQQCFSLSLKTGMVDHSGNKIAKAMPIAIITCNPVKMTGRWKETGGQVPDSDKMEYVISS